MKTIRISDERLVESLAVAAKRDNRSVSNFVARLIEMARPYWEKADWDKNYFGGTCGQSLDKAARGSGSVPRLRSRYRSQPSPQIPNVPPVKETMTVVAFNSNTAFSVDEEEEYCAPAAQMELSESVFERFQAAAQRAGLSLPAAIEAALQEKAAQLESSKPAPEIPRGFVLVNLSEREKTELRQLAREAGIELRHVLKNALCDARRNLKEWTRIKRLTGLSISEQGNFFRYMPHTN